MEKVSETKANNYIKDNEFETMKEIQYFERENISISTIPLTRTT